MNKKDAEKDLFFGNLNDTIRYLETCHDIKKNIYIDFHSMTNGIIRLYSADIDEDQAYLRIGGLTRKQKEEIDKKLFDAIGGNKDELRDEIISTAMSMKKAYFDKVKAESTKIDVPTLDISEAVAILSEYRKEGIPVYIDYVTDNGVFKLYSVDINEENVYKELYGVSKKEYLENSNAVVK